MGRIKTKGAGAGEIVGALDDEARYDPAWAKEMHRRIDEIESGIAITISEEELFFRLRERRRPDGFPTRVPRKAPTDQHRTSRPHHPMNNA
jgi:hypothetical protein